MRAVRRPARRLDAGRGCAAQRPAARAPAAPAWRAAMLRARRKRPCAAPQVSEEPGAGNAAAQLPAGADAGAQRPAERGGDRGDRAPGDARGAVAQLAAQGQAGRVRRAARGAGRAPGARMRAARGGGAAVRAPARQAGAVARWGLCVPGAPGAHRMSGRRFCRLQRRCFRIRLCASLFRTCCPGNCRGLPAARGAPWTCLNGVLLCLLCDVARGPASRGDQPAPFFSACFVFGADGSGRGAARSSLRPLVADASLTHQARGPNATMHQRRV